MDILERYRRGDRDFREAYLGGANLEVANLRAANLRGAYLGGAYLGGANLEGAHLGEQWIVQGLPRSDGYWFWLQKLTDQEPMIRAGCRCFSVPEARAHWRVTRGGTPLGEETEAIIDILVQLARVRGLMK